MERKNANDHELKNKETIAAIKELVEGKGNKCESVDDLLNELTEGKVKHAQP